MACRSAAISISENGGSRQYQPTGKKRNSELRAAYISSVPVCLRQPFRIVPDSSAFDPQRPKFFQCYVHDGHGKISGRVFPLVKKHLILPHIDGNMEQIVRLL
jgi:hypothetical protein